jgi:hypothetical protein
LFLIGVLRPVLHLRARLSALLKPTNCANMNRPVSNRYSSSTQYIYSVAHNKSTSLENATNNHHDPVSSYPPQPPVAAAAASVRPTMMTMLICTDALRNCKSHSRHAMKRSCICTWSLCKLNISTLFVITITRAAMVHHHDARHWQQGCSHLYCYDSKTTTTHGRCPHGDTS